MPNNLAIFIPTDKNIYDALQHKKVTLSELVLFLRARGIFVSEKESKQQLIEKICCLTFGYADFEWIGKLLENPNRKDKSTHSKLKGEIVNHDVKIACETVKRNIQANSRDTVAFSKTGDITTFKVTYVDHDFTKTELRQRTIKTCVIHLEKSDEGLTIKMPSTKKASEISESIKQVIKAKINNDKGHDLEEFSITLENVTNVKDRSRFFDLLTRKTVGMTLDTVTSVDVYHLDSGTLSESEEDDSTDARLASYINKAALAGEGVLESGEFKQLHDRGFYIYRLVWTAIDSATNEGPKVEFEAQFGKPDTCEDFKYSVRGLYHYNPRSGDYQVTRKAAIKSENESYDMKLRDASEESLNEILQDQEG